MHSKAFLQYLSRYCETVPEIDSLCGPHDQVVVLPCHGEDALVDAAVESILEAARHSRARALLLLVINETGASSTPHKEANRRLLNRYHPLFDSHLQLQVINRTGDARMPDGQGVGLARKIGCDAALRLHCAGIVNSEWIHTTDADARVATDYFDLKPLRAHPWGLGPLPAGAFMHPFTHECDGRIGEALSLYDRYLRYYSSGLSYAGSPFAYPTIGSTMSFCAEAYSRVRGFPKKEAAEDFYFAHKLAKTAFVWSGGGTVRLVARESDRVPFGTGRSATTILERLEQGLPYLVYSPKVFEELRTWIGCMDKVSEEGLWEEAFEQLSPILQIGLNAIGVRDQWKRISNKRHYDDRIRDWHTWFDGFRTLKLIHWLRDNAYPNVPLLADASTSGLSGGDHRSESSFRVLGV